MIVANISTSSGELAIYSLHTSVDGGGNVVVNPPTSGLLTKIDNGYGASTTIAYRSAKEDVNTNHLVPSPEVVVAIGHHAGCKSLVDQLRRRSTPMAAPANISIRLWTAGYSRVIDAR